MSQEREILPRLIAWLFRALAAGAVGFILIGMLVKPAWQAAQVFHEEAELLRLVEDEGQPATLVSLPRIEPIARLGLVEVVFRYRVPQRDETYEAGSVVRPVLAERILNMDTPPVRYAPGFEDRAVIGPITDARVRWTWTGAWRLFLPAGLMLTVVLGLFTAWLVARIRQPRPSRT